MHVNPTDVQTIGIGLAAFLSTLITAFIFLSAYKERLGRAMGTMVGMVMVWSWFGFFYQITADIAVARELRVVSVMGIVWIALASVQFSFTYLRERVPLGAYARGAQLFSIIGGVLLTFVLLNDLFDGRFIVGDLLLPPNQVLAPAAGPLLALVIAYYALCILITGVALALRARRAVDMIERRQVETVLVSLTLALTLGGMRFPPWYHVEYPLLVALSACAVPLFVIAAFYSIKRYKLLNVEVVLTQLLIFVLWTFAFFRILIDPAESSMRLDGIFFIAALILGFLLLRSLTVEMRSQKEVARLTIDRVKSEFVTIATHQLRTPLTTIRSAFSMLEPENSAAPLSPEQLVIVRGGAAAANKMVLIVNDLLNVARISGGESHFSIEPGDVRNAIRASTNLFEDAAKAKRLRFSVSIPETPLPAQFDRGKLALAIENVLDNAMKYTRENGTVSIRATRSGAHIVIRVIDSGVGIPATEHSRLFEKFFRGTSAMHMNPDGSGIGLFIAKNIIDAHHGTLSIREADGGGTEVIITLSASVG